MTVTALQLSLPVRPVPQPCDEPDRSPDAGFDQSLAKADLQVAEGIQQSVDGQGHANAQPADLRADEVADAQPDRPIVADAADEEQVGSKDAQGKSPPDRDAEPGTSFQGAGSETAFLAPPAGAFEAANVATLPVVERTVEPVELQAADQSVGRVAGQSVNQFVGSVVGQSAGQAGAAGSKTIATDGANPALLETPQFRIGAAGIPGDAATSGSAGDENGGGVFRQSALPAQAAANNAAPNGSQSAQAVLAPPVTSVSTPVTSPPPAAPMASPMSPLNVEDQANMSRVARGVANAVQQQGGTVTLRLQPPELGVVRIELQIADGTVRAAFGADQQSVRALMHQQMGQLRQALESQGLNVERLSVQALSPPANSTGTADSQDESSSDGRSRGTFDSHAGGTGAGSNNSQDAPPGEQSATFEQALNAVA